MPNSQGYNVTQSAWAMDADEDFATADIYSSENLTSFTAGELQNDYSQCYGSTIISNPSASFFSKVAWTGTLGLTAFEDNPATQIVTSSAIGLSPFYMPPWTGSGENMPQYLLWGAYISSSWLEPPEDITTTKVGVDFPNVVFDNSLLKPIFSMPEEDPLGFMVSAWVYPQRLTSSQLFEDSFGLADWCFGGTPYSVLFEAQSPYAPPFEPNEGRLNYRNCRYTILSFANQNPTFAGCGPDDELGCGEADYFKLPGTGSINLFLETRRSGTTHNLDGDYLRLTAEILVTCEDNEAGETTILMDSASTAYRIPFDEWSHILFSYEALPPGLLGMGSPTTPSWPERFAFYVNGTLATCSFFGPDDLLDYAPGRGVNYFDFDAESPSWNCPGSGAIGVDASYSRYFDPAGPMGDQWLAMSTANQSVFHGRMDEVALFPYSLQNAFGYEPGTISFNGFVGYMYNNGCPTDIAQKLLTVSNNIFGGTYPGCISPALYWRNGSLINLGNVHDKTGLGADDSGVGMSARYGTITNRMSLDEDDWPSMTGALPADTYVISGNLFAYPGKRDISYDSYGQNRGWIQFTASTACNASLVTPNKDTIIAAPIYNRKHQMATVFSPMHFGWDYPFGGIGPGTAMPYASQSVTMIIPEITPAATQMSASWMLWPYSQQELLYLLKYPLGNIEICGGNALWETGRLAGYIKSGSFLGDPRDPMYNTYGDYAKTLKIKNQTYSLIPEFRISEFIKFYELQNEGNYLAPNQSEFSIWGVPTGTNAPNPANSSEENFYKVFSNSDFLKHFSIIKADHKDGLDVNPSTISLTCKALMKFIAYDGFYPSERCLQMANQFSKSYGDSISYQGGDDYLKSARMRPFLAPFYRPGIIFNSMKSGLAVDYPVYQGQYHVINYTTNLYGLVGNMLEAATNFASPIPNTEYYALGPRDGKVFTDGSTWDYRVPFEAIVEPEKYITGMPLIDMEPHPSSSLDVIAQWDGTGNNLHQLMVSNFLAEVPEFFLPGGRFSNIQSAPEADFQTVQSGSVYAMRIKLRRSTKGKRIWRSMSNDNPLMNYSIPQDPRIIAGQVNDYKETFTMYSRESAFGPPLASDYWFGFLLAPDSGEVELDVYFSPMTAYLNTNLFLSDSTTGLNPAFTPGYYSGEAWADIIYRPKESMRPTVDDIAANSTVQLWRIDPWAAVGPQVDGSQGLTAPLYLLDNRRQGIWNGQNWASFPRAPLDAYNANNYSMQLDASFNLVGKAQDRWIIESKFETPMYNFNGENTARPLTNADDTLTIPVHGSESVPRGMWHQFGVTETEKGVYLEVGDIPQLWLASLQYRTDDPAIDNDFSYYNPLDYVVDFSAQIPASSATDIKSLSDVMGFPGSSLRLGQTAESKTISEAIVAIPFIEEDKQRKFFAIPQYIIGQALGKYGPQFGASKAGEVTRSAIEGVLPLIDEFLDDQSARQAAIAAIIGHAGGETATQVILGDTESFYPSKTIVDMVNKMKKYIFPPRLDFVANFEAVSPFAMYIFEFEHQLDQTDLSYIWQNIAPKIGSEVVEKTSSIRHVLLADQLMGNFGRGTSDNIPDGLQWMVFKVKRRANNNYFSKVSKEGDAKGAQKDYSYNWPYDFFSLIEFASIDVEVGVGKNPQALKAANKADAIADFKTNIADISVVSERPMPTPHDQQRRTARSQSSTQREKLEDEKAQEKRQERKERGKTRGKGKK